MTLQEKRAFIDAVKKCIQFAKEEGIKLGAPRGASPALLSLYALGWGDFDPSDHNLIPERFMITDYELHIDVEYKNGSKFIKYCNQVTANLTLGKIHAFKLPILDIIENTLEKLDHKIDFDAISNDDPLVLDLFRKGDVEKIFSFDFPANTLMAQQPNSTVYRDGTFKKMLKEYLISQPIHDFADLLNIESLYRLDNLDKKPFFREYIERYPIAKRDGHYYECLTSSLNESLKPNYGVIIYQEDIIQIIREYTSWSYEKCNEFRRYFSFETITENQKAEVLEHTGPEVLELLIKEAPVVFCKAHSVGAWTKLIKQTAILKSLHKDLYYSEIEKWEKIHGLSFGDFGYISGEVSLLQQ